MTSRVEDYTKNVLKVVVAQVCQTIGWNSIHQSSLEVLVDTLDRFMQELTKQTYRITELYQRTEPTLDDLALAFHYLNLNLNDIREYIDYVGPPENVTNIPKYPVPPPSILNVKRTLAEDLEAHTSATDHLQPKAEDSEDEEQFRGFFQYNREFKTEITGGTEDGSGDVKKENESGDVKPTIGGDEGRSNGDSKHDALKKASGGAARAPIKRKLTAVQMTPGGRVQGVREGRLPGADLPAIFLNEIEAALTLEQQGGFHPEPKHSKNKGHKHHQDSSNNNSRSSTPSFAGGSSARRDKLSQEPDRVKANIFKKISQPHKHSPQQSFAQNVPSSAEVIDVDSSPNPTPMYSPGLPASQHQPASASKRDKKKEKKEKRANRDSAGPQRQSSPGFNPVQIQKKAPDASLLGMLQLPAGTTLEAIPMEEEEELREQKPLANQPPHNNPFPPSIPSSIFQGVPNFSLPQGPGLIPTGGLNSPLMPPFIPVGSRMPGMLSQLSPVENVTKKSKEKESRKLKPTPSALPSNLFLPDATTVQVVKQEPSPPVALPSEERINKSTTSLLATSTVQPPVVMSATIDLLSDDDTEIGKPVVANAAAPVPDPAVVDKAAAKKAEKQKKKEQRKLEKLAAAQAAAAASSSGQDSPMNLSADGVDTGVSTKKDKQSKMERKMEKMLLKKMLKSKKVGEDGGPDEPVDMSMLNDEKKRKLEKKLKKLQKLNKQNAKAAAANEGVQNVQEVVAVTEPKAEEVTRAKTPEPLLLPKLTLKLNSPKVGEMLHSPKEVVERPHASKDYRPLTVDTGDPMTPVKRIKSESVHNSPVAVSEVLPAPAEPELAKISPLVTRPMKQQHHAQMASPSSSAGRGRPKGSTNKSHGSIGTSAVPPVIAIKQEESSVAVVNTGQGNQVWICPACGRVDDGSPMIGCDGCDNWYHWLCVGIHVAPESSEDWFCRVCIINRKEMMSGDGIGLADLSARKREKKKKKKEKRMKMEPGSD